ncbi:MAG: EI24 domain-containing protein [Erythrobacter sp.]
MRLVIASLAKATAQLRDPAILRVLVKSLLITLAIFVVIGTGLWLALDWAIEAWILTNLPDDYSDTVAAIIALTIGVLAAWLLFRIAAIAVLQFFADDIVRAVEQRHYPEAIPPARDLPLHEDIGNSLRGLSRALGINLLALPVALLLLFTAIGPAVVFLLVNAVLLGRELTDMAWLRRKGPQDTKSPVPSFDRLILGGAIAGLMAVPIVNFLAPIIGAAAGTHMTHAKLKIVSGESARNA